MRSAKMKWELALLLIGLAVFHPTAVKGKGSAEEFQRPLLSVEYEYSRSGQITGRKINGRKQSYQYDRKGQLLGVYDENGKALEEYVYDPAGNILKKTIHGRTTTYKYDKANQLVSSERDGKVTKYEYDAAGRLVKEGEKVYDYIGLDKLSSVSENGRELSSFSYDISGQLAEAVTPEKRETFQWDGLALIQRDSTCYVNEPSITGGNPILADGRVLFNDMLGTTLGIKDGDKVTQNNLSAFGESLSASTMEDSFFTGKPHVGEMGYVFLFRVYRADQGKWQTSDPLGYPDGWNNLAYCNNQFSHIDPLGLSDSFDDYNLSKLSASDYAFVKHFYTGNGTDVTLSQMGIFSAIQDEIRKQKILDRFHAQIARVAYGMAERFNYNGPLSKSFINSYDFIDASYSIGNAVLSGTFSGNMTTYWLEDGIKIYSWSGTVTLTFSDDFTDPLGVIQFVYGSSTSPDAPDWLISITNLGGDRFHVGEVWSIKMSGRGIIE